ncbi:MAG: L-glutamate gamma-semialdehyde dehydrogenase [Bacteroidales bacterium]|jgi:1-pyrroline-5-carboxylate dehydrogenase|nr:L-glutamate gamma-semialdehyde dehydrogenase [Bacteroidales bacterium]MDD3329968.1 L-glutamate gamma-semialdehyde dehydrogenase [Bacteroidales bacterium]MDD3690813.1 L-glutamate gamma-semialdehyde dehydrogenase [Bacteroidales bacterium]MDD4044874.1 L-glutamate gamma-semialdehyde dehydrogenase [Bacteroidales bacterium]MDD4581861.1 L-glutamate gamma-semialdehyde dehydrogenase [Bacteroidales bacterium]
MKNATFNFREPKNEPVYSYAPGSEERRLLQEELEKQANMQVEIPLIIGGKEIRTGNTAKVVMPCDHKHVLATYHKCTEKEVHMAIEAAMEAKEAWANLPWIERSSIMLRAAELFAKKYRYVMNAATMLGQAKNAMQAEIDSACEAIDFMRFNPHFAAKIYGEQPMSPQDCINRIEYRPLEGFVYTITPFNFTAIAVNLNISPVLMGNVTVWKPATTSLLSSYYAMKILMEAGVPAGVINFLPGSGSVISNVVLNHKDFAGIHFTGSTSVFQSFWKTVGENIAKYNTYPKLVGETGGKDFIFVHKSACAKEVATAIVRGAFEFQGQKCSAASRAFIPASLWQDVKKRVLYMLSEIKMGDVRDFSNFVNAVIDENSFDNIAGYIERAKKSNEAEIIAGGRCDKSVGYFIEPTVILAKSPTYESMVEEIFGPVISIYVYEDEKYIETLKICDSASPYALTGSIFAHDRYAVMIADQYLRNAAGNFYINDKPTGAVVGQQPFGGARASGTNDKAGSYLNLIRWTSPRTIKETLIPPTDYTYSFLKK